MQKGSEFDHKGLIHEAYRIEGITEGECRSIFLDWALSLPMEQDTGTAIRGLLGIHAAKGEDHPMTKVLTDALSPAQSVRRRGGARARRENG